jgi:hypothetical protein
MSGTGTWESSSRALRSGAYIPLSAQERGTLYTYARLTWKTAICDRESGGRPGRGTRGAVQTTEKPQASRVGCDGIVQEEGVRKGEEREESHTSVKKIMCSSSKFGTVDTSGVSPLRDPGAPGQPQILGSLTQGPVPQNAQGRCSPPSNGPSTGHCQSIRPSWPAELGTELQQWTTGVTDSRPMSGVVLIGSLCPVSRSTGPITYEEPGLIRKRTGGSTRLDGEAAGRAGAT